MSDSNSTFKFCKKCNAETERYSSGVCKPCKILRQKAWSAANPEKVSACKKKCFDANPEKYKATRAAWVSANKERCMETKAAWRGLNHDIEKASQAAWKEANREKYAEWSREYYIKNRDRLLQATKDRSKAFPERNAIYSNNKRVRKKGEKLSNGIAKKLFKLQKGKCACCGKPLGDDYHLDHIMPLALGGANADDNIQLLLSKCNMQKHAKHPIDFMQQRGFLL